MLFNGYRRGLDVRTGRKTTKTPKEKRIIRNIEPDYITRLAEDPNCVESELPPSPVDSTGRTPLRHICPTCHRSFHWLCSLKRHIQTHTGESESQQDRPFTVGSAKSLVPLRKLEPLRPYVCEKCFADFETQTHLIRHINSVHGYPMEMDHFYMPYDLGAYSVKARFKKACGLSDDPLSVAIASSCSVIDSSRETSTESGCSDNDGLGLEQKLDRLTALQNPKRPKSQLKGRPDSQNKNRFTSHMNQRSRTPSPHGVKKRLKYGDEKKTTRHSKRFPDSVKSRIFCS